MQTLVTGWTAEARGMSEERGHSRFTEIWNNFILSRPQTRPCKFTFYTYHVQYIRMRVRVGIVGCGWAGTIHAMAYANNPAVELVGMYDLRFSKARKLAQRYGAYAFHSLEELVRADLTAVSVATDPESHAEIVGQCLEAGLNVFCEKPLTRDPKTSHELCNLAATKNLSLGVNFNMRFSPLVQRVAMSIKNKNDIVFCRADLFQCPPQIKKATTFNLLLVYDAAIHLIDLMHFLVGDIFNVYAKGLYHNTLLYAISVIIQFSANSIGLLTCSFWGTQLGYAPFITLEIVTKQKHLVIYNLTDLLLTRTHKNSIHNVYVPSIFEPKEYSSLMISSINAWIQSLLIGRPPPVDGWQAFKAECVAQAIVESLTNEIPVKIKNILPEYFYYNL